MYFGSVKFFKHLIVIVVVLLILAAVALAVVLYIENNSLKEQIENQKNPETSGEVTPTDANKPVSGDEEAPSKEETPSKEEAEWPPEPSEDAGAYGTVFPDLYALENNFSSDKEYTDDTNHVYLTFDDGPNYHTTAILNYLKNCDVKATFFVVPSDGTATLLKRIHDEGHAIGVHSYSHEYSEIYESVEAFLEDFNKARDIIHKQTGVWSDVYRFPGGSINNHNEGILHDIIREMTRRGFVYFDWNVDSGDTSGASYDKMLRQVPVDISEAVEDDKRAVVLFHDAGSHTSWVIDDLINALKKDSKKYTFSVIDTNVKPVQW